MKEETYEAIRKYLVFIFPLIAVWIAAILHETYVFGYDSDIFGLTFGMRLFDTAYGPAYFITCAIIELLLLWRWMDDW